MISNVDVIGESVPGPKHKQSGEQCQDSWDKAKTEDYVIIAVGDGLGSATHSAIGSEVATQAVVAEFERRVHDIEKPLKTLDNDLVERMVREAVFTARDEVRRATQPEHELEDYHTTLSVGVVTREWYAACAIGDSGIVGIRDQGDYTPLVEREDSEHASATTPLTDDREFVEQRLRFSYAREPLKVVVGFTDGLDRFAWGTEDNSVPRPEFFDRIYTFAMEIERFEDELATTQFRQFVDSEHFHTYSDDDKTLVVGQFLREGDTESTTRSGNRTYSDEEFISAVRDKQVASTTAVKEEIECSGSTARDRLKQLAKEGKIEQTTEGRKYLWKTVDSDA